MTLDFDNCLTTYDLQEFKEQVKYKFACPISDFSLFGWNFIAM